MESTVFRRPDRISYVVFGLAVAVVLVHFIVNLTSPYGVHRDEFLYIAMGDHFSLWRMDFPPLITVVSNIERTILGDSLLSIRFMPALAEAAILLIAVNIARRLGGGAFARLLTASAMIFPVVYLRPGNLLQPVAFDQLWWTLGLGIIVRWRETSDNRWWIALGIVGGIGLLTKFSIFFFAFALLVGLLATPERRMLLTRWPWIAVVIALAIGLPTIAGQVTLHFPVVGQIQDLQRRQLTHVSWFDFVSEQFLMLGISFLVAIVGIVAALASKLWSKERIFGWIYVGAFLPLFLSHGKPYYLAPMYPAMIALGSVVIERIGSAAWRVVLRTSLVFVLIVFGFVGLPIGLPFLPKEPMARYSATFGLTAAVRTNTGGALALPQDYADMLGWQDRVEALAAAYNALPPSEQSEAVVLASNYGEAGAIDFYGPHLGLPRAVCRSGSYWFFGAGEKPGAVALAIGFEASDLRGNWSRIDTVGHIVNRWTVPEEQDLLVLRCRGEVKTLQELWPTIATN